MLNVAVKSAFSSKINLAQVIANIAMLLTVFGIDIPPETQVHIVSAIVAVQGVVTWIMRTWFTTSITAASARLIK